MPDDKTEDDKKTKDLLAELELFREGTGAVREKLAEVTRYLGVATKELEPTKVELAEKDDEEITPPLQQLGAPEAAPKGPSATE